MRRRLPSILILHAMMLAGGMVLAGATARGDDAAPPATQPAGAPQALSADERFKQVVHAYEGLDGLGLTNIPESYTAKLRRCRLIAEDIDLLLPSLKDPHEMMALAALITEFGVKQEVNTLEYWGEDPAMQAHLKPMSSAVVKLCTAASKRAEKRAADMANVLNPNDAKAAQVWEFMENLTHTADYTGNMSVYFDCIATDSNVYVDPKTKAVLTTQESLERTAKKEKLTSLRRLMADHAIGNLKEFDNADSGVEARVRNMIAKLHLAAGDFAKARDVFATVYAENSNVNPAPTPFEQYEARYFTVVAAVLNRDLAAAIRDKQSLEQWQADALPGLLKADHIALENEKSLPAAMQLLQWRIYNLAGDLPSATPAEKKQADAAASELLLKMRTSLPECARQIDRQVRKQLGKKMDPPGTLEIDGSSISIGFAAAPRSIGSDERHRIDTSPGGGIGPNGPVFGHGGNARRIVFICDGSAFIGNRTMWTLKVQLSKAFINLRPFQSFDLIFFYEKKIDSFTAFSHSDQLIFATPENKRAASKFLEGVIAGTGGNENPIPALEAAFKLHPQLIYLLTDGDFPDNDAVLKRVRELNRDSNPHVKINTIAFVGDGNKEIAWINLLKKIAIETGGAFKNVKESDL